MGYAIDLIMRDGPGAVQRLTLLLAQRNVEVEHFTARADRTNRSVHVTIGIQGDYQRAVWVMRQLSRHKDIRDASVRHAEDTQSYLDHQFAESRGGSIHERKVILRRQRRSQVVGR